MNAERDKFLKAIKDIIDRYISGQLSGQEFVASVDYVVCEEMPESMPAGIVLLVDQFQNDLALYVEDVADRAEYPAYFGPEVLLTKTREFSNGLEAISKSLN